ncbi:MAG: zinc-dependent alcohol dehydrogenase family protein [Candidatus Accumulibacter phosphatis]|uniref:alcohol dehydrogenase n=2 Tax=Candidatus Accumulibacter TaxID=327159 RepID=A0A080MEI9_9PROT|nr:MULTISPECIES: zinc-dependent alcohol dehydrogenase family protein [Candidatus Accumulibacter]KFB75594.1 MAG: Alcohol dehydrogenase [Candidatus Accumulibacter cognatus]MBL8402077.1 zinc-dependent alcohol dehydrogenase family protein [Accumulibacter sp.]MBN8517627.1 zinc-dependent alcohol dehydrogenase family protein [Accumulibacter sp.]MBO3711490.1 zinc-dependent alcohol dehydrogenase family protein [Accumulibacter sp.]MCC2869770.1 zinc-dependent alcohol dehydrogenase family protein [Candida
MKAMILDAQGQPLRLAEVPRPKPEADQVLLEVRACGVCRTDLHVMDGDLQHPSLPLVLGHEIVGVVVEKGARVERFMLGQRLGVPWLGHTCGHCRYCASGSENLCDAAEFTGYTLNGGYAEFALADQRYCFALPNGYPDAEAAPLLCAGLIGYRSLVAAGDARRLGIYGFGAAAHIIAQVARWQGREIFAFTKPGDVDGQQFARQLGATWAGDADSAPPQEMDAAILFAPVGDLVPQALRHIVKGGTVVCAGIHMSNIPEFPYAILWGERCVRSIANLTRRDGEEFFAIAPKAGVRTEVTRFPLESANAALQQLRAGEIRGAAVLITS